MAILALCISFRAANSECSQGTLSCEKFDGQAEPTLCDYTNDYELDANKKCVKKSIEGCEKKFFEPNSGCLLCKPQLVLDAQSKSCVAVAPNMLQANCERYGAFNSVCTECSAGFYLENLDCRPITKEIPHCVRYGSESSCSECASGFLLEENECVFFEKVKGCRLHRDLACDKCQTGFSLAEFSPTQTLLTDDFKSKLFKEELQVKLWSGDYHFDFCLKQNIANCLEFESFDKCKLCEKNYYLDHTKKCALNPFPKFERCLVYSDISSCKKCEFGYYLTGNPFTCKPVTSVEHCLDYMAYLNKCEKCKATHFLDSENNLCVKREVALFSNCARLSETEDGCSNCDSGFALTVDQRACLPVIENCFELQLALTKDAESHACKSCGYRKAFVGGKCVAGPDPNCLWYQEDQCVECTQYYYINEKGCSKRKVENCIEVVGLDSDECKTCSSGYFKSESKMCLEQNQQNCFKHVLSANECEECEVGYYLEGITCKRQEIANCSNYLAQKNICVACSAGFYLDKNQNSCLKQYVPNCVAYKLDSNDCTQCISHYILNTESNSCELPDLANCIKFKPNSNDCESDGCQKGYFLQNKQCKPQNQPFCIDFEPNSNTCVTCQAGYYLDKDDNNSCKQQTVLNCVEFTYDSPDCVKCSLGYELVDSKTCTQKVVANCVSYDDNTLSCTKCRIGFYLNDSNTCDKQNVVNCIGYQVDSEQCSECSAGFVLNSVKNQCEAFGGANCIDWNPQNGDCVKCAAHFKLLDDKSCQKMEVAGCVEFDQDGNCQKCQA
ncbi:MAG: hypothetical protein AAFO91_02345, partial [Bacteroidota bacterium]